MSRWTTLVGAAELIDALSDRSDLVIVDARALLSDRAGSRASFAAAHIPGARYADLETDLAGAHTHGAGRHPWPDDDRFAQLLGRLGIGRDSQVVVYDEAQGALAASRLWFMLKAWGHDAVAVLDGGLAAWRDAGGPLTDAAPADGAGRYDGTFDRSRLLDSAGVERLLGEGGTVVDARAAERYRGEVEPLDRKAGHIPGALNRPFTANLEGGRFKPPAALRTEFEALLGARPVSRVALSCGSGVTACHHLLAMEHAGLQGAALYTGSWSGWIEDDARPVAVGPAPGSD